jgi:hypothetical protein
MEKLKIKGKYDDHLSLWNDEQERRFCERKIKEYRGVGKGYDNRWCE